MRKVGSEKELEEKKKTRTIYISLFMLIVLVFGTVGYAFVSNLGAEEQQTNEEVNGRYRVDFQGENFYLINSLEDVADIPVDTFISLEDYTGKPLYISSKNEGLIAEIYPLFSKYSSRIQEACYGGCEEDLPEKDCSENLIVWKDSTEDKVYQEKNCIFIEGDLKAVDAFIYKLAEVN